LNRHGPIEQFPPDVLGENQALALRFKDLATLRTNAALFAQVDELRWSGPTATFAGIGPPASLTLALLERARKATPAQPDAPRS
jgi:hypothetical protein